MDAKISAHRIEMTLQQDGMLTLEHLPFRAGQSVEVIVLAQPDAAAAESGDCYPLRGTPFRYDRPTEPITELGWLGKESSGTP
jgi:hypothetical protein